MRKPSSSTKMINFFDPVEPMTVAPDQKVPLDGFSGKIRYLKSALTFQINRLSKKN